MGLAPVWRLRARPGLMPAVAAGESGVLAPRPEPGGPGVPPAGDRAARILQMDWPLLRQVVEACAACDLHKSRNKTVFGDGDEQADWMLIGDAPGTEDDSRGEAFAGQAGRLLDNMLGAIGLARGQNVYISNVLKCRPPDNRNPEPVQIAQCLPHLRRQIGLIRPKLIFAMGRFAVQTLLGTDATITSLRGRLHYYEGVPLVVSYPPAYLLRSLADKAGAWEDLCLARQTMQDMLCVSPSQD